MQRKKQNTSFNTVAPCQQSNGGKSQADSSHLNNKEDMAQSCGRGIAP